jgi:hypothetical protein
MIIDLAKNLPASIQQTVKDAGLETVNSCTRTDTVRFPLRRPEGPGLEGLWTNYSVRQMNFSATEETAQIQFKKWTEGEDGWPCPPIYIDAIFHFSKQKFTHLSISFGGEYRKYKLITHEGPSQKPIDQTCIDLFDSVIDTSKDFSIPPPFALNLIYTDE